MNADHQISCMCPTCKVDTLHSPSTPVGKRRLMHALKITVALATFGFGFPNAIAGDQMPADCERCGKSVQVPYTG